MKADIMKQVNSDHYYEMTYNSKGRFCSYWHQIDEVIKLKPTSILEIGAGHRFVADFLQKAGIEVTTLDIDPDLKPTVVGSILDMPFPDNNFDVVMCCQVLEHLPYESFMPALKQIYRVSKNHVILSLPNMKPVYRFYVEIPKFQIGFFYPRPFSKKLNWEFNGEHYWNISNQGYPLSRIMSDLEAANFKIRRHYRVPENSFHHFFILSK